MIAEREAAHPPRSPGKPCAAMAVVASRVQNMTVNPALRAGGLELTLLWGAALTVFALIEARIRISIVPLEVGIAAGLVFSLVRFVKMPLQGRAMLWAVLFSGFTVYYYALHFAAAPFPLAVWYFVFSRAAAVLIAVMLALRLAQIGDGERILRLCVLAGIWLHGSVIILNAIMPPLRPLLQQLAQTYTAAGTRSVGAAGSVYYEFGLEIYRATGLVGVPTVSNAITAVLGLAALYLFTRSGRVSLLYAAWLCAIAALLSFSRAAMLGLTPALFIVTLSAFRSQQMPRSRWLPAAAAALGVVTLYGLLVQLSGDQVFVLLRRFGELLNLSTSESAVGRSGAYAQFFARVQEEPLLLLTGDALVNRFLSIAGLGQDLTAGFVSNGWFLLLFEYGVMVFVPAFLGALWALSTTWKASRTHALILLSLYWMFASDNHIYLSGSMTALWLSSVLYVTFVSSRAAAGTRVSLRSVAA
jgi:hypothetical protein